MSVVPPASGVAPDEAIPIERCLRPDDRAADGPGTDARTVVALSLLGLALLLVCLYWNRIALGGRMGRAPQWVHDLSRPITALHEAVIGPIQTDPVGTPQTHRITQLVRSWAVATAAYFAGVWLVLRRPHRVSGVALDVVIAAAVVFRVVLIFSPPILETDPCRYLWDGATLTSGVNPYRHAPLEVLEWKMWTARRGVPDHPAYDARGNAELRALAELSSDPDLNWQFMYINHPATPTVYPPLAQHLFSLAHRLDPANVLMLKALVALIDLGILWLVAQLLALLRRPACWILIYGWCPLVLKEYAQTGHYDPAATFCLLGALYLLLRGWNRLAGAYLGLAALGKLYPLVVVPALLRRLGPATILLTVLTITLFWAPFLDIGAGAFDGLLAYSRDWVMNSSVFSLLKEGPLAFLDRNPPVVRLGKGTVPGRDSTGRVREIRLDAQFGAKLAVGLLYLAILVVLARRPAAEGDEIVARAFTAVAALFLLSPVCNPWYCAWIIPFAALSGRVSWVVLAGTMSAYYALWGTHTYRVSPWPGTLPAVDLRLIEYVPFYLLLALEAWRDRRVVSARS